MNEAIIYTQFWMKLDVLRIFGDGWNLLFTTNEWHGIKQNFPMYNDNNDMK